MSNPKDMETSQLVGSAVANIVIRALLLRGLLKAVKQERPAKALAMIWFLHSTPEDRARRLAILGELSERLSPDPTYMDQATSDAFDQPDPTVSPAPPGPEYGWTR